MRRSEKPSPFTWRTSVLLAVVFIATTALTAPIYALEIEPALATSPGCVQSASTDLKAESATIALIPRPWPTTCYQGRTCDERIDCGYDSTQGGWQGVCVDNICYCY